MTNAGLDGGLIGTDFANDLSNSNPLVITDISDLPHVLADLWCCDPLRYFWKPSMTATGQTLAFSHGTTVRTENIKNLTFGNWCSKVRR